jgi:N-methylhydantoinase A
MTDAIPNLVIGIDTGGTFTDATMLDVSSGRTWTAKTPSTPADPSVGFADAVAKILAQSGFTADNVERVLHGTTVATNLILENKGPVVGLLVNEGFRYLIEIARQDSPLGTSPMKWIKPPRLVTPQNIFEIAGRLDHAGNELTPLDEEAIRHAARQLRANGIDAISIAFLHSYVNPDHERRAGAILREEYPEALISLSSDVIPVFREYERSMTTNLNAYVMRAVATYVAQIERRLEEQGISAPLMLMKSSGGVASSASICARPVETALSGPAAGIVGANFVGDRLREANLICVDIGGTSADISVIAQGAATIVPTGKVGNWPISLPMVEVTTIGAGGGSIARVSKNGVLSVGPESAGAVPGPVCYGRGGTEPTITDAHLVLGHLPSHLLDGGFILDRDSAVEAVRSHIAEPLGISLEEAAEGILAIADNHMMGTIRLLSVERGLDPREFVMVPFGGAGPLHGGSLARLLGMETMLLVPSPGVLCALGLLVSNLKAEFAQTCLQNSGAWDLAQISDAHRKLQSEAIAWFDAEAVPQNARHLNMVASMRYEHQGFELSIPWAGDGVDEDALAATVEAFHVLHERLYTFAQRDTLVELINIRIDATGRFDAPAMAEAPATGDADDARTGEVSAYVEGAWRSVPVYDRARLGVGARVSGPAILTQVDTTTWLLPDQHGEVVGFGAMLVSDARMAASPANGDA